MNHLASLIQSFVQSGTGNMGDVTDESSPARFALPDADRFVLSYFRMRFGRGTGTATLALRIDHRLGTLFDFESVTREGVGTTGIRTVEYRVPFNELFHLVFHKGPHHEQDVACFTWDNPDTGNLDPDDDMQWSIEVGLIDVAHLEMHIAPRLP